ncbi:MAG: hypothetical protein RL150_217 [Candidatus Parcubacteria bacterium]|jgi:succinate dehydrogenase flavin-adding protein (antitoxin of CptAB toxin-antitoxin module)
MTNALPDDFLETMGLDELPMEEQAAVMTEMSDAIMAGVFARVLPMLSEEHKAEFDKLMDSDADQDAVVAFLQERVPEFQAIVVEEVAAFSKEAGDFYGGL